MLSKLRSKNNTTREMEKTREAQAVIDLVQIMIAKMIWREMQMETTLMLMATLLMLKSMNMATRLELLKTLALLKTLERLSLARMNTSRDQSQLRLLRKENMVSLCPSHLVST